MKTKFSLIFLACSAFHLVSEAGCRREVVNGVDTNQATHICEAMLNGAVNGCREATPTSMAACYCYIGNWSCSCRN